MTGRGCDGLLARAGVGAARGLATPSVVSTMDARTMAARSRLLALVRGADANQLRPGGERECVCEGKEAEKAARPDGWATLIRSEGGSWEETTSGTRREGGAFSFHLPHPMAPFCCPRARHSNGRHVKLHSSLSGPYKPKSRHDGLSCTSPPHTARGDLFFSPRAKSVLCDHAASPGWMMGLQHRADQP
jgi:hypothetical protein